MVKVSAVMALKDNEYFSDSIESVLNQSLDDIEVICIGQNEFAHEKVKYASDMESAADEITGQYVYFLNQGDVIDKNLFRDCVGICEDKNLDFLQFDSDDEFDSEIHSFVFLKGKTFRMDMARNTKFFKTSFARQLEGIGEDDYLFFWEAVLNAKRFSFYPAQVTSKDVTESYDYQLDLIDISNRVFTKFIDRDLYVRYNFLLFDWRLELLYNTYMNVPDELKEDYYTHLKEDFTKMVYHHRFTYFAYGTKPICMLFFSDVVYSNDFEEFEKLMVQYEIALDTENVRKENEIIKKNIEFFKKENDKIFNSTSWKITEPLRRKK
ncbi:hypothetical protein [Methanobrevibacter sp.]|uniref:hypothetical protein n=1 Tax=Methanobrevibacter sp. TaxID=66852 RepID=UPI00388F1705